MDFFLLALFTALYEVLIVLLTMAITDRKKLLASILSGSIEPLKLISTVIVVRSGSMTDVIIGITVVSVTCSIANYFTIHFVEKFEERRQRLEEG
jgi:hypothetical protein